MPGDVTEVPALEVLAAQLAALQGEVAALGATNAHLAEELAAVRAAPTPPTDTPSSAVPHPGARRFPLARRRADSRGAATSAPVARTSRRGMLGTAAKVAAATVAAGVLAEQVGTRAAYADNLGNFSSSVGGTYAVTVDGSNGAPGITVSTDSGDGIDVTSNGAPAISATSGGGVGVLALSDMGLAVSATSYTSTGVYASGDIGVDATGTTYGIRATTHTGIAALAQTSNASAYGVYGNNTSNTSGSVAVLGHSDDGTGSGLGPGIGVQGETAGGQGVRGTATTGVGVYGTTAGGASTQAIYAVGTSGSTGLRATSDTGNGLVALSTSGTGLNVQSSTGSAVVATSNGVGYGLYLTAPSGWAIGCVGRMRVIGAAVGSVTLAHGTTSKQVVSTACSGASQVILTATSDPQVRIWAVAAPGAFTVHASSAPSADVTFSYFLIN